MKLRGFKACMTGLVLGLTMVCSVGCGGGKSAAVEAYEGKLLEFKTSVEGIGEKIDAINAQSDDAVNELLFYVDAINNDFQALLDLTVPEGYESITRLNEKAANYMSSAAEYFHSAYGGDAFDENAYATANTYYAKAFEMVNYTGQVLQGANISFASDEE